MVWATEAQKSILGTGILVGHQELIALVVWDAYPIGHWPCFAHRASSYTMWQGSTLCFPIL